MKRKTRAQFMAQYVTGEWADDASPAFSVLRFLLSIDEWHAFLTKQRCPRGYRSPRVNPRVVKLLRNVALDCKQLLLNDSFKTWLRRQLVNDVRRVAGTKPTRWTEHEFLRQVVGVSEEVTRVPKRRKAKVASVPAALLPPPLSLNEDVLMRIAEQVKMMQGS